MVTLRQLRYFVAIAEERSFVRAAQRLHVSQPPLSSQVKALEETLSVQLLRRDSRNVELTDAGRVLLQGAQRALADLQRTISETQRAASGEIGDLRIGAVGISLFSVLPTIRAGLNAQLPDVSMTIVHQRSRELQRALLRGDIDLALFHVPSEDPALRVETIHHEPFCAILPLGHRLARCQEFSLLMLKDEGFVNYSRPAATMLFDFVVAACIRAGFSPKIRHTGDYLAMVQMVAVGLGVALVPRALAHRSRELVAVHDLPDDDLAVSLELAWKRDQTSPLVQRAAALICEAYGVRGATARP